MCEEELDLLRRILEQFRYGDDDRPTLAGYDVRTGAKVRIEVGDELELLLDDAKQYLGVE